VPISPYLPSKRVTDRFGYCCFASSNVLLKEDQRYPVPMQVANPQNLTAMILLTLLFQVLRLEKHFQFDQETSFVVVQSYEPFIYHRWAVISG
jgi:hypothetical protein